MTGRPRRTGWLDIPALQYATRVNGLDALALTKLDVLTGLPEVKVCVGYRAADGSEHGFPIDDPPGVTPVYQSLPGWAETRGHARKLEDLPKAARAYVEFIEERVACPIELVSVGSRRDETILLVDPFAV